MVRYIDHDRKELAPRNGNGWSVAAVAAGMVRALETHGSPVPGWLSLLRDEAGAKPRVETAIFGMG